MQLQIDMIFDLNLSIYLFNLEHYSEMFTVWNDI